jgi:parallel beta helix pectate lyase-like protein
MCRPSLMLPLSISVTLLVICLLSSAAQAQASRTWVSGVGDDANPCSRTAPCKTFAGAISKTASGGEIDALDPGGFGTVTITKAITIDGGGGQVAGILAAGTNGIAVSAGPTGVVTLRNLRINGIDGTGQGGLNGIRYLSGAALHVENCNIFGFTQDGINVVTSAASALFVTDTFLTNNGNGIHIAPTAANIKSMLVRVRAQGNSGFGIYLNPSAGVGAGTVIDDSSALVNGTGIGVTGATLYLGNSVIIRNNVGVSITGGSVLSYKTNMIDGNLGGDGTPLPGIPLN